MPITGKKRKVLCVFLFSTSASLMYLYRYNKSTSIKTTHPQLAISFTADGQEDSGLCRSFVNLSCHCCLMPLKQASTALKDLRLCTTNFISFSMIVTIFVETADGQHVRLYASCHPSKTRCAYAKSPHKPKTPSSSVAISTHIFRNPNALI